MWSAGACIYRDTFQQGPRFGMDHGQQQEFIFQWDRSISSIGFGGCGMD
jgi:hypothetical protein